MNANQITELLYKKFESHKYQLTNTFVYNEESDFFSITNSGYAGLMYILPNGKIKVIKKAPFIHKEKHDLKQVLLDKFYYLSQRLKNENKFYKKSLEG